MFDWLRYRINYYKLSMHYFICLFPQSLLKYKIMRELYELIWLLGLAKLWCFAYHRDRWQYTETREYYYSGYTNEVKLKVFCNKCGSKHIRFRVLYTEKAVEEILKGYTPHSNEYTYKNDELVKTQLESLQTGKNDK